MKRDHKIYRVLLLVLSLMLILTSCGGGGGGGSAGGGGGSTPAPPFIAAEVDSFPTGSVPPGLLPSGFNSLASVFVIDVNSGAPITNAAVIMNGVTLMYDVTNQDYEGNVVVDPGIDVTLSVTVGGNTYTASNTQFTSYPSISSPALSSTWLVSDFIPVMWSSGTPTTNASFYGLGVLDANDPNGNLVWPSNTNNTLQVISIGNYYPIPANSLTSGSRLVIVGIATDVPISDAASGSSFIIAGFNYVPITVTTTGTPTNVTASPGEGQATISWTAVTGAISYNIYWSTTAANATKLSGTKIAGVTSPYVHYTGLAGGATYYYVVTAVGTDGESRESAVASATPGSPITATPGNGQVTISWTAVTGATSYNIYWSTTAANATKLSGTKIAGVTSPYIHTGLTNGTPYYYVVTAVTAGGESAESTSVTAIPGTLLMGGSVEGFPLTLSNTVTTLAGATGYCGSTDGTGLAASFCSPSGITTDGTNLYVTDSYYSTIRKIAISTGVVTTLAGSAGLSGSTDGTGSAARFNSPSGITTDGTNLYVADTGNNTIRKIVISTGEVSTLAGSAGLSGSTDGTGSAARFNGPSGITTDGTNLYVADEFNSTIRKIVISTGMVTTLAGTAGIQGSSDGTGSAATFYNPHGITMDGTNLYVTDSWNDTIRKIVISTSVVTTLAGTSTPGGCGSTDGMGSAARFCYPEGITTDATNLYVTDTGNWAVRKIVISTGVVTTLAGSTDFFGMTHGITTDGIDLFVTDMSTVKKIQ